MENENHSKLLPEFKVQTELESKIKKNYSDMLIAMNKTVVIEFWQGILNENKTDDIES